MSVREGIQASAVEIVSTSTRTEESESQTYTVRLQPRLHVTFDESVIDNEHLGRKKSNSKYGWRIYYIKRYYYIYSRILM
jgi:hypothetical protein